MVVEDTEDEQGRKGVTIPAETDQLYTFKLYAVLTITNKDRLEVSVSTAGIATLGAIDDAMEKHNQDPEAHPGMMEKFAGEHNDDPEAHPGMTARIRATEIALNGSETILSKNGDPTTETEGVKGQHYINLIPGLSSSATTSRTRATSGGRLTSRPPCGICWRRQRKPQNRQRTWPTAQRRLSPPSRTPFR